jgi:hypothetical protein
MVLPAAPLMAPPAVVEKVMVTATALLAATRLFIAIVKVGLKTLSPI